MTSPQLPEETPSNEAPKGNRPAQGARQITAAEAFGPNGLLPQTAGDFLGLSGELQEGVTLQPGAVLPAAAQPVRAPQAPAAAAAPRQTQAATEPTPAAGPRKRSLAPLLIGGIVLAASAAAVPFLGGDDPAPGQPKPVARNEKQVPSPKPTQAEAGAVEEAWVADAEEARHEAVDNASSEQLAAQMEPAPAVEPLSESLSEVAVGSLLDPVASLSAPTQDPIANEWTEADQRLAALLSGPGSQPDPALDLDAHLDSDCDDPNCEADTEPSLPHDEGLLQVAAVTDAAPVAPPTWEPALEPGTEALDEPIPWPEEEPVVEPVIKPVIEPVVEPAPGIESVVEPLPESVPPHVPQPATAGTAESKPAMPPAPAPLPAGTDADNGVVVLWNSTEIPHQHIRGAARMQTPNVGTVRLTTQEAESFTGRLLSVGQGKVWLQIDPLGKLAFDISTIQELALPSRSAGPAPVKGALTIGSWAKSLSEGGTMYGKIVALNDKTGTLQLENGARLTVDLARLEPAKPPAAKEETGKVKVKKSDKPRPVPKPKPQPRK
jgi:hypothetical protein